MIRTSEDVEDYLLDAATTLMARTGSKNGLILIGRVKDPDHLAPFLSLFPCTSLYILAPLITTVSSAQHDNSDLLRCFQERYYGIATEWVTAIIMDIKGQPLVAP
jgi:hypothetical protein